MDKYALLIDVTSIQKFIFGSNRLKENLGASHLISNLFNDTVSQILPNPLLDKNTGNYDGYVGGGNALYFFNIQNEAESFLENWTKHLLVYAPGIAVATAISKWDEQDFKTSRDGLFEKLRENKSKYIAQTIDQRHGISAECQSDGYSMDVWKDIYQDDGKIDKEKSNYVSASTFAKLEAYKKAKDIINNDFFITGDLERLGQSKGSENHVAIVHIDGNSMGDRFKQLKSLRETKELSDTLKAAVKESFRSLLARIITEIKDDKLKDYLNIKPDKYKNNKKPLPIRPIIMGGDDITFVCDGRMGIYYAKIFMEEFAKQIVSDGKPLSSCAGISVIKTKYPFYKGYQLAEELCANAKSRRRELKDEGSWLDFHITYGGFSGELKEIRKTYYNAQLGSLIYRPYKIDDSPDYSFGDFVKRSKELKKEWPNNKIKELREVLTLGKDAVGTFYNEINSRGLHLEDVGSKKFNKNIFVNDVTPYFDMIELLEYYPKYELEVE